MEALEILRTWFSKAESWQKDLFCQLWGGLDDDLSAKERAIGLAKQEYLSEKHKLTANTLFPTDINFLGTMGCPVLLKSISDVKGVGALNPDSPLEFCDGLTIVYGENGCGKSTFAKILKNAGNPNNSAPILGNIYEKTKIPAQATLSFSEDGETYTVNWKPNMKNACTLQIYDTSTAKQFVENENEVIYEPKILSAFTRMAAIYDEISTEFKQLKEKTETKLSALPVKIEDSPLIREFMQLSKIKEIEKYNKTVNWNDANLTELKAIEESIKDADPQKSAQSLRAQKTVINNHITKILNLMESVNDDFCIKVYLFNRKKQISAKRIADQLIESSKNVSCLPYFGTDVWRNMWSVAKTYAQTLPKKMESSNVQVDSRCVLCQQELTPDSLVRLETFEEFATSRAIADSDTAYEQFNSIVMKVQAHVNEKLNLENIRTELDSNSISREIQELIMGFYHELHNRCLWLLNYEDEVDPKLPSLSSIIDVTSKFGKLLSDLDVNINALENVVKNADVLTQRKEFLQAKQWIANNINVKTEMIKLNTVISKCKTNELTKTKKNLANILITDAYVSRFQMEMSELDTQKRIQAELVSNVKRGRAYYQISLKGAVEKKKNGEILSEGEYRVVSLAAFLADLSSWNRIQPFIFDDPITSLDHKFEKHVADRLVKLSAERQVIVFTHRLAFAELLSSSASSFNVKASTLDSGQQVSVKHVELRKFPLGEPMGTTYTGDGNLGKALNKLRNENVPKLIKSLANKEYDTYDRGLLSLCTSIRNLVEKSIETTLLSGIVSRFGYVVQSQKLRYLYAIKDKDIELFDEMMTKYSYYDHSQSTERPATLPELQDIEKDLERLDSWYLDFQKRRKDEDDRKKRKPLKPKQN